MVIEMQKYRPSNGTEGWEFEKEWCYFCVFFSDDPDVADPCEILCLANVYDINDPEYPDEWVRDENGPRCTAFVATNNNRHIPDMELK